MLKCTKDNMFVVAVGTIFQNAIEFQSITYFEALLADLFLYSHEAEIV